MALRLPSFGPPSGAFSASVPGRSCSTLSRRVRGRRGATGTGVGACHDWPDASPCFPPCPLSCPLTQPGRPRQGNGIVLTDRVTPPRPQHKEMRPLTPDEADTFLATTREDRLHALYAVL